jgi:hypothetical protein
MTVCHRHADRAGVSVVPLFGAYRTGIITEVVIRNAVGHLRFITCSMTNVWQSHPKRSDRICGGGGRLQCFALKNHDASFSLEATGETKISAGVEAASALRFQSDVCYKARSFLVPLVRIASTPWVEL